MPDGWHDRMRRVVRRLLPDSARDGKPVATEQRFTHEGAVEIRSLLDQMAGTHGEERARYRRRLRRKGFHIGDFPDVDDWSASAFDRLRSEGRVTVREDAEIGQSV